MYSRAMSFLFNQTDFDEAPEELKVLHAHWESLRRNRPGPTLKEFDLLQIPSPLLPCTVIVDYLANEGVFKFRYYGSQVANRHSQEMTGKTTADFNWKPFGEALDKEYRAFLARGKPEYVSFSYTNEIGAKELHRVLRMPLSEDGKTITGILIVIMALIKNYESQEIFTKNGLRYE